MYTRRNNHETDHRDEATGTEITSPNTCTDISGDTRLPDESAYGGSTKGPSNKGRRTQQGVVLDVFGQPVPTAASLLTKAAARVAASLVPERVPGEANEARSPGSVIYAHPPRGAGAGHCTAVDEADGRDGAETEEPGDLFSLNAEGNVEATFHVSMDGKETAAMMMGLRPESGWEGKAPIGTLAEACQVSRLDQEYDFVRYSLARMRVSQARDSELHGLSLLRQ